MSLPQRMTIALSQDCADSHVLLSAPQDWTDDAHFSVTLPSNTCHDQSTLEVVFTPSWEQEHTSELNIPYTHIESPLKIFLEANVSAPLPLLIIGGQLRRILSHDYGQSIVSETQNAGVQKRVCYGDGGYLIVGGMDQGVIWRSQTGRLAAIHIRHRVHRCMRIWKQPICHVCRWPLLFHCGCGMGRRFRHSVDGRRNQTSPLETVYLLRLVIKAASQPQRTVHIGSAMHCRKLSAQVCRFWK